MKKSDSHMPKRWQWWQVWDSKSKMAQFDVFLAHNSLDKKEVELIAAELKKRHLSPWMDEGEILPGRSFQHEIQKAIPLVKSAAIFIGARGLGGWQSLELRSLTNQFVERNIPVIPVLLPGVEEMPKNLIFLKEFRWVSFSQSVNDERALYLLECGIRGKKPEETPPRNTEIPLRVGVKKKLLAIVLSLSLTLNFMLIVKVIKTFGISEVLNLWPTSPTPTPNTIELEQPKPTPSDWEGW